MAASVTKRLWEMSDVVDMLEAWENIRKAAKMIGPAMAEQIIPFLVVGAALTVIGVMVYFFPATALVCLGSLSLCGAAVFAVAAFAAFGTKTDAQVILGAFVGFYALASAGGALFTGLALIAAGGAVSSIRRRTP